MLNFLPRVTKSVSDGRSVNPSMRKFDGWTRRSSAVLSLIAAATSAPLVRFVVPTSRRTAPDWAMTSGMREAAADLDELAARDDDSRPAASAASTTLSPPRCC
jgi:hypothetical protein